MAALTPQGVATARVKELAVRAGFDLVGVTHVSPFAREHQAIQQRIHEGLFEGLPWFTADRAEISTDPTALLPEAKSIIALGLSYDTGSGPAGIIARYAWGHDYHDVIRTRLKVLQKSLVQEFGEFEFRNFVDTGRMVDRAAAVRAGLGWYGKNTNLLNTHLGSWVFLAELITTLELEPDKPTRQSCGRCHACIDVCPTGAIVQPYVVDNNRCISFLTIELRGPIPRELRPLMGSYIFGCDLCQDVCPVNSQAQLVRHPEFAFEGDLGNVQELAALLLLTEDDFHERFRRSPIKRARRRGLLRNVCVALGNSGAASAVGPLAHALQNDPEPLVRGHAAWGLGRLRHGTAHDALEAAAAAEPDAYVLEEIACALTAQ